jgi:hypothetical protein
VGLRLQERILIAGSVIIVKRKRGLSLLGVLMLLLKLHSSLKLITHALAGFQRPHLISDRPQILLLLFNCREGCTF